MEYKSKLEVPGTHGLGVGGPPRAGTGNYLELLLPTSTNKEVLVAQM